MQNFRLTYPQQNIWLVEKVNKDLPINSIVGTVEINAKFDEKICNDAINYVIKNNDAMRINIVNVDAEVCQNVKEYKYKNFEVVDMSLSSESEIKEYINGCVLLPLLIDENELFEFKIFNYGSGKGAIFMKIHHIISDAWSCSKIGTQLIEYMQAKLNGEEVVDEIKPSYIEFIQKEIEYENSEKYAKDEEFWKEYLKDVKEAVSLSNVANDMFDTKASRYSVKLDEELNNKINEYCKENKVSPYALFMGALATYLYRVKETDDFVIGTPILNRSNFKEKQMLGMFISTIPMRIKITEGIKFVDLAKEIGRNNLELFRHQKYPYPKALEYVRNNSDIKTNLYNIVLSYQNARADLVNNDEYSTTWAFVNHLSDELQIHVMDMDNTGVLNINYDYKTSLFSDIQIKYLHERIMAIIEDALSNIDVDIENIRIMSKEEENKILYEFNNTSTYYPKDKTVIDLFEEQVEKNPDKVALVFEDKEMTYKELNEKANKLAYYLRYEKGINTGDIVAVAIDKSFELYISILAILKADGIYLPIDINLPSDRIEYMLKNCNCKNTLVVDDFEYINNKINIKNIKFSNSSKKISRSSKYDDLVYVMYTSGSTGKPKGAAMYNYNVVKLVKNINYFDMEQVDIVFLAGSVGFDASMHEMWLNFLNGKKGYIITKNIMLNPSEYEKIIKNCDNTIAIFTTQLFHKYANYNPEMFNKVKYLVAGGDIMLSQYASKVKKLCSNTNIINIYGPTECSAATTTYEYKGNEKIIPIGKPISNTKCYILDEKMRLLPIGCEGKLWIAGDGVGAGYINNKEVTNKSFIFRDNICIYDSGDIVRYNEDGNILFIGRKDFQLKINGYRIEKGEIQNIALQFGGIDEVYIKTIQENGFKELLMYITSDDNINIEDLKRYMNKKLPIYMVPKKIMVIDKLPLKLSGKVDEEKLPEYIDKISVDNKEINDVNQLERFILEYFKKLLNIENLNVNSDLFEYGLDSLKIATIIMMFNNNNIENIGYQDIYDLRTVKNIVNHINGEMVEQEENYFDDYDYSNINKLIQNNNNVNFNTKNITDNILLAGATGFLGAHILYELLESTNVNIYCVVRHKKETSYTRLKEKFVSYFDIKSWEKYEKRIKILDCDLIENIDLEFLSKTIKDNNIKFIINSAADVKHYGLREISYKMNVKIVENLIELSNITKSKLVHISTLSVSGNSFEGSFESQNLDTKVIFDESKIYIGQNLKNIYTYTKYIAEIKVLEAILDKGIEAVIIRVGNLTNSTVTSKNQTNITDNGFVQRIKFLVDNKIISKTLYENLYLEFSPVNLVAKSIKILCSLENSNTIYHLYNNKHMNLKDFIKIYNSNNKERINILDDKIFMRKTNDILKTEKVFSYRVLVEDFKNKNDDVYKTNIEVASNITNSILEKNDFIWPEITEEYILNFINNIYEVRGGNSDN